MAEAHHTPPTKQTTLRKLRHDLRTPLGQIIGYSEMLQEELEERGLVDLLPDLEHVRSGALALVDLIGRMFEGGPAGAPAAEAVAEQGALTGAGTEAQAALPTPRAKILLVDDEAANREMLARRLARRGYEVDTADDGRSALHVIEQQNFDLVLLDVLMPGMSGIEVLRAIRRTRSPAELPVIMVTGLDGTADTVEALRRGANDYITKPINLAVALARVEAHLRLKRATQEIESLARRLEVQTAFIRNTFGRYVSDEVVANLLETPAGLDLCGEQRRVTILMTDLRGFSSMTQVLSPRQIVALLNNYLGRMAEVVQSYQGTIDEFIGDAVLAFFGAPLSHPDDAERAVACALTMQRAIDEVNAENRARGLPDVEMGIGIATGDVVVGNIGSEKRTKYGAVGSAINLAARIESQTLGGEIWIDPETRRALGDLAEVACERVVHPKGFGEPLRIARIMGIGGRYAIRLTVDDPDCVALAKEVPVTFAPFEGKNVSHRVRPGSLWALSSRAAKLRTDNPLEEGTDLCVEFADGQTPGAWYARVVSGSGHEPSVTVRFTMRQGACAERLDTLLGAARELLPAGQQLPSEQDLRRPSRGSLRRSSH